jgi:hypothetical protein
MDLQNVNLQTALHLAVERQHTQIVRVRHLKCTRHLCRTFDDALSIFHTLQSTYDIIAVHTALNATMNILIVLKGQNRPSYVRQFILKIFMKLYSDH